MGSGRDVKRPFPSPLLLWLKEGYLNEYVSGLGPPLALHVKGRKSKAAAPFVERASRIFSGQHILWAVERDLGNTSGSGSLPVKLGPNGKPIRHQVEWLQPFHEAVKRIESPRREALRFYLAARALIPEQELLTSMAISMDMPVIQVMGLLERATREAVALIGEDRAGPLPSDVRERYASTPRRSGGARLAPRNLAPRGSGRGSPDAGIRRIAPAKERG